VVSKVTIKPEIKVTEVSTCRIMPFDGNLPEKINYKLPLESEIIPPFKLPYPVFRADDK
jgi:hypothetical protein